MVPIGLRQTLASAVEVETRYVKQSGGRGVFAVVVMRFEPLSAERLAEWEHRWREAGREPDANGNYFDDESHGAIPRECVPAVEEAFRQAAARPLPFVHVLATLVGGKYHDAGLPCRGFPAAASQCFREAQAQAGVVLLEAVMEMVVEVPETALADVEADVNRRRGVVLDFGPGAQARSAILRAAVPEATLVENGLVGGVVPVSMAFSHFAPVEPEAVGLPRLGG